MVHIVKTGVVQVCQSLWRPCPAINAAAQDTLSKLLRTLCLDLGRRGAIKNISSSTKLVKIFHHTSLWKQSRPGLAVRNSPTPLCGNCLWRRTYRMLHWSHLRTLGVRYEENVRYERRMTVAVAWRGSQLPIVSAQTLLHCSVP